VVVVLSSESGPYEEALAGFRESFSQPFATLVLSKGDPDIPKSTHLIVAIGGKAAMYPYEAWRVPLIYCVAPGVYANREQHTGPQTKVYVSPPPRILLQKLKELQPGLRRLGALWVGESALTYGPALKHEGERLGVTVLTERLKSPDELPDYLRAIKGRADALWIAPDPQLITPQSFGMMRQFALNNSIPLYASIDGLADKGAAASVSVSFHEMGRKAGVMAMQALAGTSEVPTAAYGDTVSVTINTAAAVQSGLSIPAEILNKADRVIR
jgi:ABC-type uncharacterized transport system substrate-binding protein